MNALTKPETFTAVRAPQYTAEQIDLIKRTVCKGGTDDELKLFMYQCERTGLDALARQIYAVKRWDSSQSREVMGVQVSIDGFRLIAERSGHYAGQLGPYWCGKDGVWQDAWLSSESPAASKVGVMRDDFKEPCWGVARFDAYASRKNGGGLTMMWASKGDIMVAKCAEALALRKAFPQELSGLYTSDEMDQAADHGNGSTDPKPAPTPAPQTQRDAIHTLKTPEPIREQDPDVVKGLRNWADQNKAEISEAERLPDLYMWLDENGESWTNPTSSSNLRKLQRHAPEILEELKTHYMATLAEIGKKATK